MVGSKLNHVIEGVCDVHILRWILSAHACVEYPVGTIMTEAEKAMSIMFLTGVNYRETMDAPDDTKKTLHECKWWKWLFRLH